jgi:hypothetical protein
MLYSGKLSIPYLFRPKANIIIQVINYWGVDVSSIRLILIYSAIRGGRDSLLSRQEMALLEKEGIFI